MTSPFVWRLSTDCSRFEVQLQWKLQCRRQSMSYWREKQVSAGVFRMGNSGINKLLSHYCRYQ